VGAQTCALPLFCDRDLAINLVTLKLEGGQDILKMCPYTENEAASLRHSKLRARIEKNTEICLKVKVKLSKALNYLDRCRNTCSYQAPAIFRVACFSLP